MGTAFGHEEMSLVRFGPLFTGNLKEESDHHWLIEAVKRPDVDSAYSKLLIEIRKDLKQPAQIQYFDSGSRLLKTEKRLEYGCRGKVCAPRVIQMIDHSRGDLSSKLVKKLDGEYRSTGYVFLSSVPSAWKLEGSSRRMVSLRFIHVLALGLLIVWPLVTIAERDAVAEETLPVSVGEVLDASELEVVGATWARVIRKCTDPGRLNVCVREMTQELYVFLDDAKRDAIYRALVQHYCEGIIECPISTESLRAATFRSPYESSSPYGPVSTEDPSPYASPREADSPYGEPVDLGAVGESEMQLPWLAASPEQEDVGELGLLELDWNVSGRSIIHVRLEDKSQGEFYNRQTLTPGLARYQNSANLMVEARYGEIISALDLDVDWIGYSNTELSEVGDFPGRPSDDLIGFELNALYLIWDRPFGVSGIGLKVGQQRVQWGVADQFNPTNTINPNDLRDVLLFGQQAANLMAVMDIAMGDSWVLDLVWAPIFRAALLPKTGDVSVVSVDRVPFYDENLRWQLHVDRELAEAYNKPTVVEQIVADKPEFAPENQSFAIRVSGQVGRQDLTYSYSYGFRDLPVPTSTSSTGRNQEVCSGDQCIEGVIANEVVLEYPRQQVVGVNLTGEIPTLGGSSVGYRFEAAMTFPEKMRAEIELADVQVANFPPQNGPYNYIAPDGGLPVVYDDAPFLKWTLGFDYTVTRSLYLNAMWVHGFVDEFGAGDWFFPGAVDVRAGGSISRDAGDLLDCRGLVEKILVANALQNGTARKLPTIWSWALITDLRRIEH